MINKQNMFFLRRKRVREKRQQEKIKKDLKKQLQSEAKKILLEEDLRLTTEENGKLESLYHHSNSYRTPQDRSKEPSLWNNNERDTSDSRERSMSKGNSQGPESIDGDLSLGNEAYLSQHLERMKSKSFDRKSPRSRNSKGSKASSFHSNKSMKFKTIKSSFLIPNPLLKMSAEDLGENSPVLDKNRLRYASKTWRVGRSALKSKENSQNPKMINPKIKGFSDKEDNEPGQLSADSKEIHEKLENFYKSDVYRSKPAPKSPNQSRVKKRFNCRDWTVKFKQAYNVRLKNQNRFFKATKKRRPAITRRGGNKDETSPQLSQKVMVEGIQLKPRAQNLPEKAKDHELSDKKSVEAYPNKSAREGNSSIQKKLSDAGGKNSVGKIDQHGDQNHFMKGFVNRTKSHQFRRFTKKNGFYLKDQAVRSSKFFSKRGRPGEPVYTPRKAINLRNGVSKTAVRSRISFGRRVEMARQSYRAGSPAMQAATHARIKSGSQPLSRDLPLRNKVNNPTTQATQENSEQQIKTVRSSQALGSNVRAFNYKIKMSLKPRESNRTRSGSTGSDALTNKISERKVIANTSQKMNTSFFHGYNGGIIRKNTFTKEKNYQIYSKQKLIKRPGSDHQSGMGKDKRAVCLKNSNPGKNMQIRVKTPFSKTRRTKISEQTKRLLETKPHLIIQNSTGKQSYMSYRYSTRYTGSNERRIKRRRLSDLNDSEEVREDGNQQLRVRNVFTNSPFKGLNQRMKASKAKKGAYVNPILTKITTYRATY